MPLELVSKALYSIRNIIGLPERRYLDLLPNDVLVDNVFFYLDVVDILRVRRLNKRLYNLTHHAIVWKRLLYRTDLPLPPLPPTSRHNLRGLSSTEAERLLVRAYSLDKIWTQTPAALDEWSFESWYHVAEMKLLPGSQYLVASVSDASRTDWSIVLYVMDSRYGVLPIAKKDTKTKAYNLQAKYMTVGGVVGVTVAYVRMAWRFKEHSERGLNISDFDGNYDLDLPYPVEYECVTSHISLESLETLSNPKLVPGSEAFLDAARKQPKPFLVVDSFTDYAKLSCLCLDEFRGKPALTLVKQPHIVMFRPLAGPPEVEMILSSYPGYEEWDHRIKVIRPLPQQGQVLVIREVKVPLWRNRYAITGIELVNIPKNNGAHPIEKECIPQDFMFFFEDEFSDIYINDHDTPNWLDDSIIPSLRPNWQEEEWKPRPISLYLRTITPDDGMMRLTFYPRMFEGPVECPIALRPGEPIEDDPDYHWRYSLDYCSPARWVECHLNCTYRILPGAHRTLLYTTSWDEITSSPKVVGVYRYHDRDCFIDVPEPLEPGVEPPLRYPVKKLPFTDVGERFEAVAWDENIGRLCYVTPGSTMVGVMDLAKRPKQDPLGRRFPVPLQIDHDVFDQEEYERERMPLMQLDDSPPGSPHIHVIPARRRLERDVPRDGDIDSSDDEAEMPIQDVPMDDDDFELDHFEGDMFEQVVPVNGP